MARPGVYRMLNAAAEVLYVGKARNLKARVSNYARPSGHSGRIARMIHETASMMFLTTRTETEALLLEQNLIKQLKPRYNVLLRDDKSFPEHPDLHGTSLSADQEASRQEVRKGQLLRSLRRRRRGQPHAEPVAEGVPAAQLLGRDVRKPHAPLPAVPDQALLCPLRGQDQPRGLCQPGRRRDSLPGRQDHRRPGRPGHRDDRGGLEPWNSNARPRCATASAP